MNQEAIDEAARILWHSWRHGSRIDSLPASCRPGTRTDAYAIQAEVARVSGQRVAGWKIAATSTAGQKHIGVDGPLAGRLLSGRILGSGDAVPLADNLMQVAEAEFAFRIGMSLPPRATAYTLGQVIDAVESVHPAIEIPDSRYDDFVTAGAAQLIADNACACWFVLGPASQIDWRELDLIAHRVVATRNGSVTEHGRGANALGDPRIALTWIANELCAYDKGLQKDDIVTTGTCIVPMPIASGDLIRADFGKLGGVEARID